MFFPNLSSCSTKTIVGSNAKMAFSNCSLKNTSVKFKGSSNKSRSYLKAKQLQEKLESDNQNFSDEAQHQEAIDAMTSDMEEIKNHLVDDNMVVKKGTEGITVKVFPQ